MDDGEEKEMDPRDDDDDDDRVRGRIDENGKKDVERERDVGGIGRWLSMVRGVYTFGLFVQLSKRGVSELHLRERNERGVQERVDPVRKNEGA